MSDIRLTVVDLGDGLTAEAVGIAVTVHEGTAGGGGGGVTDHGALTGLADDDHTQYALADGSRGTFETAGAVAAHAAAGDPHPAYLTEAEGDAAYDALGAAAAAQAAAEGTAAAALTTHHGASSTDHDDRYYTEAEVDTALGGKANTSHTHTLTDVTDAGDSAALDVGTSAGTVAAGDHTHTGPAGFQVSAEPPYTGPHSSASTVNTASRAMACPIRIAAPMYVRALWLDVTTGAAGATNEWGLFNASATPAAATKLAGGSGAMSSTGWQPILAASAPVLVQPGSYMLIFRSSAATPPTWRTQVYADAVPFFRAQTSYAWDDTPDLTTGWTTTTTVVPCLLEGDMDAAGTRFVGA